MNQVHFIRIIGLGKEERLCPDHPTGKDKIDEGMNGPLRAVVELRGPTVAEHRGFSRPVMAKGLFGIYLIKT